MSQHEPNQGEGTAPGSLQGLSAQQALDLAVDHHGAGRLQQADALYQHVLTLVPNQPVALNLSGVIALQQGRPEVAVGLIRQAVKSDPDYIEAHSNLGLALAEQGLGEDALKCHRQALEIKPDSVDALCNLGNTLHQLKRNEEAVATYQRALQLAPQSPDILFNLANAHLAAGQLHDAVSNYTDALELHPNYAEAHSNLGGAYSKLDRFDDAIASYAAALSLRPRDLETLCSLAAALAQAGQHKEAIDTYRKALAIRSDFPKAMDGLSRVFTTLGNKAVLTRDHLAEFGIDQSQPACNLVLSRVMGQVVPRWHVPMMNDAPRNEAYLAAVKQAVNPDSHVLEIGTGSGLLAMMAARQGASHVTTCEMVPVVAETARRIVADNGLESRITVIAKRSNDVNVGVEMDARADILVSEILSSEFISEGVLASIEDAKQRLLTPDARIIPASGSMMIALFGGEDIAKNIHVSDVCGFDLSRFNRITAAKHAFHRTDLVFELLSDDVAAFDFDFMAHDRFPPEQKVLQVPITQAGTCYGIVQWNRLQMDAETSFENHPGVIEPASAWNHAVYVLPEPMKVDPGQIAIITATHDCQTPWFTLEELDTE